MNNIILINDNKEKYVFELNSVIIKDGKLYELTPDEIEKYNNGTYFKEFLNDEFQAEFDLDLYVHDSPYYLSEYKVIID